MRQVIRTGLFIALMLATVAMANAQAPINGTYKSFDLDAGSPLLKGRTSVCWGIPGGRLIVGNVSNLQSWDGPQLGGGGLLGLQWEVYCASIASIVVLLDIPNFQKIVQINYSGGLFFLDGAGPWGGGDASYTGALTELTEVRTIQFDFFTGEVNGTNSVYGFTSGVDGYPGTCFILAQSNDAYIGDTDITVIDPGTVKPAYYPDFLNGFCVGGQTYGRWGNMSAVTLNVTGCAVSTEDATWGLIKRLHLE